MQLIAPDELAKAVNARSVNDLFTNAANQALSDLEAMLRTSLPRAVRRDTFQINVLSRQTVRDHMRLVLSAGIVDLTQPVNASWAQSHKSDPIPLDLEDVLIDAATGNVCLYGDGARDGYVVIEYTAGLPVDEKSPETLVGAPQWMLDAYTLLVLDHYQRDDDEDKEKHSDTRVKAAAALANHVRWQADAFYAVSVEVEPALTEEPM